MYSPLLLNHERTVINHIILESGIKFHSPTPILITAIPVESRNHLNRTCLTKWSMLKEQHIMPRSKEIQEQMRNKISDMYQSGKGYKAISKALGLRAIIYKLRKLGTVVNLLRSGWPTKITPRAKWRLIQEVIKELRTTSKELQASLASIKVSVHESTIRKKLGKNSIHGRTPRQEPLLTKNNTKAHLTFAKKDLDIYIYIQYILYMCIYIYIYILVVGRYRR